jgi:transposase-like zinc-binding protein/putative transposase
MQRPLLELAAIVGAAGHRFLDRPPAWFTWLHVQILVAIEQCRTAAMGGHLDQCSSCGQQAISYNSCRNRHCPKCQSQARDRWLGARRAELLAVPYSHVVFTLSHQLAPLPLQNKQVIYGLLFRCSAETLIEIAADSKHLGAEIGFFAVLHTWNQKLQHHPHVHCVVPAGGLSPDHLAGCICPIHASSFPRRFSAKSSVANLAHPCARLTPPADYSFTACFEDSPTPDSFRV